MSHTKRRNKRYSVHYIDSLYPYTYYYDNDGKHISKKLNIQSYYTFSRKDLIDEFTDFFVRDNDVFKRIVKDLTKIDYSLIKYNKESYNNKYTGYYSNIDKQYFEIKVFIDNKWRDIDIESLKHEVFNRLIKYKYYPRSHTIFSKFENGHWIYYRRRYKIKKHSKYDHWDKHAYKHFDLIKEEFRIKYPY